MSAGGGSGAARMAAVALDGTVAIALAVGAGVGAALLARGSLIALFIALGAGALIGVVAAFVMARVGGGSLGQRVAGVPSHRAKTAATPPWNASPPAPSAPRITAPTAGFGYLGDSSTRPPGPAPVGVAASTVRPHVPGRAPAAASAEYPPVAAPAQVSVAPVVGAAHAADPRVAQQAATRPFAVVPAAPGPPPAVAASGRPFLLRAPSEPILAVPGVRPHRHPHQAPPVTTPSVEVPAASGVETIAPPRPVAMNDAFAAPTDRPAHAVLVWDDGTRGSVYSRTLFGRNPAPEAGALTMVVRDESLTISKTHFELAIDGARAWVVDRYSTNGIVISRGGHRYASEPGVRTELFGGDQLELGDRRVTVTVTR